MKVTDDLTSKNYLIKLNDAQADLVVAKEQEIENLDKFYDLKKADTKLTGDIDLINIKDRHQNDISEQILSKQQRLDSIKSNFANEQTKLEKEKKLLTDSHQEKIHDINNIYDYKYRDSYDIANTKAKDINLETTETIHKLQDESDRIILDLNFKSKIHSDVKERENNKKISAQEQQHVKMAKRTDDSYERKVAAAVIDHENKLSDQNHKQLVERNERHKFHNFEMKAKEEHHKELLLQEDKSFKQKYNLMAKSHQSILDRVKERFNNQVNSIVKNQMKYKKNISEKAGDDFYKVSSINPSIKEGITDYEVSIKVPEHEKENVRLTAHGRKVTVSLTRRFQDELTSEDGSTSKSKRSEIFTKKMETSQILNPRQITQSYHEGILTFKVAKL
ncbi:hypothetical protein A9Q84_06280 [Halobacteriovorax marinus]|uniref:SHSP domain-containing protein n=1 Tax=Halobacteriovorax marinus TaxID=97084 RepID=A0A1Y5FDM3_9BACT|nr:hypothetical protein A9Q84_06280 [Halobacteriovorax marinus]